MVSALDNPARHHPSNKRLKTACLPFAIGKGLEVGPFDRPFFAKEEADVEYLDYRTTEEARAFAEIAPGHDPQFVPAIDYVVPPSGDWSAVADERFDWILSSHAFEHSPNLIEMLETVASKLKPGGVMITMLPDKRRTFDVHRPLSTLGQVIEDYVRDTRLCRPQAAFDQVYYARVMPISDAKRTYDENPDFLPSDGHFAAAMSAARNALGGYVDSHNYIFTSQSFEHIVNALCANAVIPFIPIHILHTLDDDMTFLSVLRKDHD